MFSFCQVTRQSKVNWGLSGSFTCGSVSGPKMGQSEPVSPLLPTVTCFEFPLLFICFPNMLNYGTVN